jgi:gentisate 1,2-dioxygenase
VLLPGEETAPIRHSSTAVGFCLRGTGDARIADTSFAFDQYDVWCIPSMAPYTYRNTGTDVHARLQYSNAPVLEKLRVHVVETDFPAPDERATVEEGDRSAIDHLIDLDGGAQLLSYERLIDPPRIESPVLHWPWVEVKARLDKLHALGESYKGRRLYLMYNPATGRTNGTTFSFFATMCLRPANIVDRALLVTDSVESAMRLAREVADRDLRPLSTLLAAGTRPHADITIFKAMGIGLADVALGRAILEA